MGLEAGWRKILLELFPYCFLDSMPSNVPIKYVIDDYFLAAFRLIYGVDNWGDLRRRVVERTIRYDALSKNIEIYIALFDEKRFVPLAKSPTQVKRLEKSSMPLSPEECEAFMPGSTDLHSMDKNAKPGEYIHRAWITGATKSKIIAFMTDAFCDIDYPDKSMARRIVIDGAKVDYLVKNENLGRRNFDHVKNDIDTERHLDPLVAYECEIHIPTKSEHLIAKSERLIGTQNKDDGRGFKSCTLYHSNTVGEADMKIVLHITRLLPYGNVFINSCDSDMIAILLLNMKDWIDPKTSKIPHSIYLDNTSAKEGAKSSYVDVVLLWTSILVYFEIHFPSVLNPIEVFVSMMIASGSDYVESMKQVTTPLQIWKAFQNGGYELLFQPSETKPLLSFYPKKKTLIKSNETIDENAKLMSDLNINEFGSCFPMHALVLCTQTYGNPNAYHEVHLLEDKLYEFILFLYERNLITKKDNLQVSLPTSIDEKYLFLNNLATQRDAKTNHVPRKMEMKSPQEIKAEIRRLAWNLDYWINGGKPNRKFEHPEQPYFQNCLETNYHGVSVWGWERDANSNLVVRTKMVTPY